MCVQRDTLDTLQSQSFVSYEQKDSNSHFIKKRRLEYFAYMMQNNKYRLLHVIPKETTDDRKMS